MGKKKREEKKFSGYSNSKERQGIKEKKQNREKGRSLSALFVLLRGNIRPETSGWLPSGHAQKHAHTHWQTYTLLWCLDPWVPSCCLPGHLILVISTTETEKGR